MFQAATESQKVQNAFETAFSLVEPDIKKTKCPQMEPVTTLISVAEDCHDIQVKDMTGNVVGFIDLG